MTGSIQVSKGKYYMVFNIYENGKRKQKWVATGLSEKGNKKKAQEMLYQKLANWEKDNPLDVISSDILFCDWIVRWLEYTKPNVRLSTYEGYEVHARHIIKYFKKKEITLKNLKPFHIEEYFNHMLIEGKTNQKTKEKSGLAVRTVRSHKFIIKSALDRAVVNELIKYNPANAVKVTNKKNKDLARPIVFFTSKQANDFIEFINTKQDVLADLIFVTLYYGLRRSEVLGLAKDAFDFENRKMYIQRTVVKITSTYDSYKTKTLASCSSFNLTDDMIAYFKQILKKKEENKKYFGNEYIGSDFLFTWQDGRPFNPDYIYHHFKDLVKEFGTPNMTFHGLRHSCASILYEKGWSAKDIQLWLRHADYYTTMNIYTHIDNYFNVERSQRIVGTLKIPI